MPLKSRPLTEAGVRGETPRAADGSGAEAQPRDARIREQLGRWWAEEFPRDVLPTEALIRLSEQLATFDMFDKPTQPTHDALVAALTVSTQALDSLADAFDFMPATAAEGAAATHLRRLAADNRAALALAERADAGTMEKRKEEAR